MVKRVLELNGTKLLNPRYKKTYGLTKKQWDHSRQCFFFRLWFARCTSLEYESFRYPEVDPLPFGTNEILKELIPGKLGPGTKTSILTMQYKRSQ